MSDVLYRATKYMNAEDALLAREEKTKKRERQEDVQQDKGREITRTEERQALQASHREIHEFHPADYPDRPSLDVNQR